MNRHKTAKASNFTLLALSCCVALLIVVVLLQIGLIRLHLQTNDADDQPVDTGTETTALQGDAEQGSKQAVGMIRKPIIAFIFDGIYDWNSDASEMVKAHGYRCGNAPQYTNIHDGNNLDVLKAIEADGHEILCHGTYILGENATEEEVAEKVKESYTTMVNAGFDPKGYIASSGRNNPYFMKYLPKYYEYAATEANKSDEQVPYHNFKTSHPYELWRYILNGATVEQLKSAVDIAIENGGLLLFYGHAKSEAADHFSKEALEELLTYIDGKVAKREVAVMLPSEAVADYYTIRYEDIIG